MPIVQTYPEDFVDIAKEECLKRQLLEKIASASKKYQVSPRRLILSNLYSSNNFIEILHEHFFSEHSLLYRNRKMMILDPTPCLILMFPLMMKRHLRS